MMDIARSTLEDHCHSTQSTTASRKAAWNCIMQRGRHLLILRRNATEFSGPEVIWDGTKDWKRVLWSDESTFQLVFGKNRCRILRAKDEKDHPEENRTMATTDCWADQVLYTPRMGKNCTCKTATISKCVILSVLETSIYKLVFI